MMNFNNSNNNCLSYSKYLISPELQLALKKETQLKYDNKSMTKDPGVFVVCIRILNRNKTNVLLYNYIYYPPIFSTTFIGFLLNRDLNSIRYREWGDNLLLLNKDVLLNDSNFKEIQNSNSIDPYMLNNEEIIKSTLNNLDNATSYYVGNDIYGIIRIINRLNYITCDYEEISNILELALLKEYKKYVRLLLPNWYDSLESNIDESVSDINLVNSLIFVVRDINKFVKSFVNRGYIINEGPQPWRGQSNSMNNLLNLLDIDYRTALYNHNNYFIKNGLIDRKFELSKRSFSFRNIHMNLGNIRWYSTKRKVYPKNITNKILDKVSVRNSFKTESEIYLYLNNYLSKAPINETTERNIENYLLSFYTNSLEEKDKKTSLNSLKIDLFSNIKIKKFLMESNEFIENYLNNFKKRTFNIDVKRVSSKVKSSYYLKLILIELGNLPIIEISTGILARIISGYNKLNEECIGQNIIYELGNMIIDSYFYSLYNRYIIKNVELFIINCKEFLDQNNIEDISLKNEILNKISKLEKNIKNLETYEIRFLIKKLLEINDLYKINFNNIDLISEYTFSDWKNDNKVIIDLYDNNLIFSIGSLIIDWLKDANLIQENLLVKSQKDRRTFYIPSDYLIKLLIENNVKGISSLPLRIPMITKPKLYYREVVNGTVKERLGGYLINDERITDPMIIHNWKLRENTIIDDPNVIYNLVNNLNSVGYKINKDVLDFIYLYGDQYNLLLNENLDYLKIKGVKLTKREEMELQSYLSKLDLQENILGLAEVYSKVSEFYLPVRIEYRGRVICISQYLNYQSTELAKSLLLFSKGEKLMKNDIIAINYFKSYGANCYGNKLDKISWEDRAKWVDQNENDIINFSNGKLINEAENKLLFIAFCFEYNKWLKAYNNIETSYFETYLPIQFDATCNGFQHLSLLINDYEMAKELNLTKSTKQDLPKDYYQFMITKLIELFKSKLSSTKLSSEDLDCYNRLSNILIKRSSIKKAIMTIPYNISIPKMIEYLKEHFIKDDINSDIEWSNYKLIYRYKENSNVILCNKDISLIASGLKEVLYTNFPRLKQFIIYLKSIATLFTKLNLPITWATSSGLIVNQSYTLSKEVKLRPFSYNTTSFILKERLNKLDLDKQKRSFMPNLIHSLDASALSLLSEYIFEDNLNKRNFYAIHDCFAVTANNVEKLEKNLKLVYVKIYSTDNYLIKMDEYFRSLIKLVYGDNSFINKNEINIIIEDKIIIEKFPNLDLVLGKELPSIDFDKSSYIIN